MALTVWLLFYSISTGPGADFLMKPLEDPYPPVQINELPSADVILVLGGMINPFSSRNGSVEFLGTAERILAAEDLFQNNKASLIMISGGSGFLLAEAEAEADILKRWLVHRRFNPEKILIENQSRNTMENAQLTIKILSDFKIKKVILVTSAFHMKRSLLSFRNAPFEIIPFPVDYYSSRKNTGIDRFIPGPLALYQSTLALKEYAGLIAYSIKKQILQND